MPATPVTGCVTLGGFLTSLNLVLFSCKMVLVVVCGHLLGLLWSSQEGCTLKPQHGGLHRRVREASARSHLRDSRASHLHLARGQRELQRKTYLLFKSFSFKKAALGCTSSGKPPPLPEAHMRAAFTKPVCHLVQAGLTWSRVSPLRIVCLVRWEQSEGKADFCLWVKLGAWVND